MITLKNAVLNSNEVTSSAFVDALGKLIKRDISIKNAYAIIKITKEVDAQLKIFVEAKMSLFKKHGDEGENGSISVPKDKEEAFITEMNELLEMEFTLTSDPIDLSNEDIVIPTIELMSLGAVIKTDDTAEEKSPTE